MKYLFDSFMEYVIDWNCFKFSSSNIIPNMAYTLSIRCDKFRIMLEHSANIFGLPHAFSVINGYDRMDIGQGIITIDLPFAICEKNLKLSSVRFGHTIL